MPIATSCPEFAATLERWDDAAALVTEAGVAISYRDLADRADAFAAQLPAGARLLGISVSNDVEPVAAYLGALRAGVPVVMMSSEAGQASLRKDCPPDAIYAPASLGRGWRLEVRPVDWAAAPNPALALLLSTSGSTGGAKLVKLSGANLQANAASIAEFLGLTASERAITTLPLSYSYGLSVLNSHLCVGASVVLTGESVANPAFERLLTRHGVTSLAGVPYSYELMDRCGLLDRLPRTVRTLTQAGGRLAPDLVTRVGSRARAQGVAFYVMYGQTEATARIAYMPPERLAEDPYGIGCPIPGGELWIEDERGRRLPALSEGELVYRGPNVMMGYALSRDDLAEPAGSDILHTGDLAVQAAGGSFRITGRKSRFVKPFGLRIGLDELEQCAVRAGLDVVFSGDDNLVVALGKAAHEQGVRAEFAALGLPEQLLEYVARSQRPQLRGGKTDYLTVLKLGRAQREAPARARTGGVAAVEEYYHRLAKGAPVTAATTFESLDGDSMSYIQGSLLIEEAVGRLPERWEALSLGELERRVAAKEPKTLGMRWLTLEGDVLVRALAILLVVVNHAVGHLDGGSNVLLLLAGMTWSRFQRKRLEKGEAGEVIQNFGTRYLIFYLLILASVSILRWRIDYWHFLFVSTFVADWSGILNIYWFIESLTWCVGFVCLAYAIPRLRRALAAQPFAWALGFVGFALVLRLAGAEVFDAAGNEYRSPDQTLSFFAIGWAIAQARPVFRTALIGLAIAMSVAVYGLTDTHVIAISVAGLLLALAQRLKAPSLVTGVVRAIAAASFYIYMWNAIPMFLTDSLLHAPYGRYWPMQIAATLAGGLILSILVERWSARPRAPRPGGAAGWGVFARGAEG